MKVKSACLLLAVLFLVSSTNALTLTAYSDPGVYDHFSVVSSNGISCFSFLRTSILGNLSIDNVTVSTDGLNPVPEPATMLLLGSGLIGLAGYGRKRFKK